MMEMSKRQFRFNFRYLLEYEVFGTLLAKLKSRGGDAVASLTRKMT